jgi:ATP-dependent DNA ligase
MGMKPIVLYDKAKNGKIKQWSIETKGDKIITKHGYIDGKMAEKSKVIHKGKNIGKSNETTPEKQAELEARSKVKLQRRKGYTEKLNDLIAGKVKVNYNPMLAKTYEPGKGMLPKNCYAQPKLDGIRCVAVKKDYCVRFWSRTGKEFLVLWDLARELNHVMDNDTIWDGELYYHGWSFERITRAVKKECPDSYKIQYHVYDIPKTNGVAGDQTKFSVRNCWLEFAHKATINDRLKFYTAVPVSDETLAIILHDEYVRNGYEGLILRDGDAPYLWKHRGKELLKYKEFVDEEFRIIGYRSGSGVDEGTIIFKCHTGGRRDKCLQYNANGSGYFDVRPKGTVEHRRDMYAVGWRYVGKMLTVRYQERTLYDVPKFPVGITIRDYE